MPSGLFRNGLIRRQSRHQQTSHVQIQSRVSCPRKDLGLEGRKSFYKGYQGMFLIVRPTNQESRLFQLWEGDIFAAGVEG